MGREVRRVPPSWKHPKDENGKYIPMYDKSYEDAISEWIEGHHLWSEGRHPSQIEQPEWAAQYKYYAEWEGVPEVESHRPKWDEEPTWYQVYSLVNAGTPVTPPFETQEELIDYLCKYGAEGVYASPWNRDAAEKFVKGDQWLPTLQFRAPEGV